MGYRPRFTREYSLFAEPLTPAVRVLLIANVLVFVLRVLVHGQVPGVFDYLFGLSAEWYRNGMVWQLGTYMFLHAGFIHLLFNMLILYFLGTEIERTLGGRNFLIIYWVAGVLGGLGWSLLTEVGVCIGASGAVLGLLGAYVALFPQRQITVLIFFIIPVTMRAWVLAVILGGIDFLLMATHISSPIAHAAHLAGLVAGYSFVFVVFKKRRWRIRFRSGRRARGLKVLRNDDGVPAHEDEIDRILDKIALKGMSSLTRQERETLAAASAARRSPDVRT